jgi:hypothetical protein
MSRPIGIGRDSSTMDLLLLALWQIRSPVLERSVISDPPAANDHWHAICLQEKGNATCSSREGELSYLKDWDVASVHE